MAKIITHAHNSRRLIRLTSDDVLMIINRLQRDFRGQKATYDGITKALAEQPLYIPEEVT
ncbi:MAG: hypothetical protein KC476_02700 [Cyanobacteria bacterium HKST-UBA06]|nr:hypothetical protein [Cyanobacteria bacterium HKST-UBA05]MCA9798294.1 hypothetical protein [Cyanobacteria bacterium HKST-UBA04]MCA9806840.1 hypothetical protein [Cyanobacteria bacterium HKST-UBA06]MCA9841708.1 hypothetical protein [Cyanobacteria bacterium HKST-UBA03]